MDKVYEFLLDKLQYGDTVVVGVSGGPDSMALLHVMISLRKQLELDVICAHVNHNTGRPGQIEDEKFVKEWCLKNNVTLEHMTIDDYGDDNFHNEARSKRYVYFEKIVNNHHAKYLLTAHHGDDLMETILMRIVRGSTLRGYSGFSKIVPMDTYTILRPFINITKADILEYNRNNNIEYREDDSNLKDVYTRNRFRKYIVPEFKKEDPNVHQKFAKFSKTLLMYNDYIDKEVKKVISKVYPQNILNIEEFKKLEYVIQLKVIYYILENIYQDDLMLITDQHASLIYNLINSKKVNSYIYLPNNLKALKEYNRLTFVTEPIHSNEYEIEIIDYLNLPNGKNIEVIEETKETSNFICRLNKKDIVLPLRVRTRQNGDKMHIKGMVGSKKINDIFIDDKIPSGERDMWPIVVDSNNTVVWLPGLKKSKYDVPISENCDIILKYY